MPKTQKDFTIITGQTVHNTLFSDPKKVLRLIKRAYISHYQEQTINPKSTFLRFTDNQDARIIGLPAHLKGKDSISGIKWIASYPDNIKKNMPRASAVLILNNPYNGQAFSCIEAGIISAVRTAASAVNAANHLALKNQRARLGIIGTGLISNYILAFFIYMGWEFDKISLFDLFPEYSKKFSEANDSENLRIKVSTSLEDVIQNSDIIVFSTTAASPYVYDTNLFKHNPLVLNISLRDIGPDIILNACNVVDDPQHIFQENTSLAIALQKSAKTPLLVKSFPEMLAQKKRREKKDQLTIFSPFGLGILDLVLGRYIYQSAKKTNNLIQINNFYYQTKRYKSVKYA